MIVEKIFVEDIENPGCNNGNYPQFTMEFDDGTVYEGVTCRCRCGCSDTMRLPRIGQSFVSIADYEDWSEYAFYPGLDFSAQAACLGGESLEKGRARKMNAF